MSHLEELKEKIKAALPGLDVVIGWEAGFDPIHATPLFIRKPEDVDRLIVGPLCVHNLATYLPGFKGKKVGIVVKGCDSRAVIELLQEGLIQRDQVKIFGLSCDGVVSLDKVRAAVGDLGFISAVKTNGATVTVTADGKDFPLALDKVRADKCDNCRYPDALLFDTFIGTPQDRRDGVSPVHPTQAEFDNWTDDERFAFWHQEMNRCIRCYACRNACPMCVCRDHCIATTREPQWLSQENNVADNWMFQMIHVMHLAGRCVECGECARACPMDIPLMLLRRRMNGAVREVFNYEAGIDEHGVPPLLTFKVEEDNIVEREW